MASMLAALLLFFSGCVAVVERPADVEVVESERHGPPPWAPAHGWRRKNETYLLLPDHPSLLLSESETILLA